jgi:hypothetical protein
MHPAFKFFLAYVLRKTKDSKIFVSSTSPPNLPLSIKRLCHNSVFLAADFSLRKPFVEFQQLTQSKDCGYKVKT